MLTITKNYRSHSVLLFFHIRNFPPGFVVHCHPFRFQKWDAETDPEPGYTEADPLEASTKGEQLPVSGAFSLLKVMPSVSHREWPPAASVPGAEKRQAAVPGWRDPLPPVPQPGRALGLLFPGLVSHGFGSPKNPSCVRGRGVMGIRGFREWESRKWQ